MKKDEVLVSRTNGTLEYLNFNEFSSVVILDDTGNVASVYGESKLLGKIYDSDIDRVRDQRSCIVYDRNISDRVDFKSQSTFRRRSTSPVLK